MKIRTFGVGLEVLSHYLLHCPNFINERTLLLNDGVSRIITSALPFCKTTFVKLLYGNNSFESSRNTLILNASVEDFLSCKRFVGPLL